MKNYRKTRVQNKKHAPNYPTSVHCFFPIFTAPHEHVRRGRRAVVRAAAGTAFRRLAGGNGGLATATVGLQIEHDTWAAPDEYHESLPSPKPLRIAFQQSDIDPRSQEFLVEIIFQACMKHGRL